MDTVTVITVTAGAARTVCNVLVIGRSAVFTDSGCSFSGGTSVSRLAPTRACAATAPPVVLVRRPSRRICL